MTQGYNICRTGSEEYCPACRLKGQKQALRTYRISFSESICLCENPQCIYPLGKPVNLITNPDTENSQPQQSQTKRKILKTTSSEPCSKQLRTDTSIGADCTLNAELISEKNGNNLQKSEPCSLDLLQDIQLEHYEPGVSLEQSMAVEAACTIDVAPEISPENIQSTSELLSPKLELCNVQSQVAEKIPRSQLVPPPFFLQWQNKYSLCWLDCILSALVQSVILKKTVTEAYPRDDESVVQKLFTEYNKACALLAGCPMKADNTVEVSAERLCQAEMYLNEIRRAIFEKLQPQLKCELGNKESPVFAFPLLLKEDTWLEKLFLHSFSWKFECALCGYKYQQRCMKSLTTFTSIIPEWHPLNAIHTAPCNNCQDKSQRRRMILESISSVFMLHFVEGLPHNCLETYSFQFEGDSYQIRTVIQYQIDHFVTWVLNEDGTWLEYDDLKGPYCCRHEKLEVPATKIHIVCWERKISAVSNELNSQLQREQTPTPAVADVQSDTSLRPQSDANAEAITKLAVSPKKQVSSLPINKSQNVNLGKANNLLSGLEGLADDDVITLTLVEVQVDSEGNPVENSHMSGDLVFERNAQQQQQENISVPFSPQASHMGDVQNNLTGSESPQFENATACPVLNKFCPTSTAASPGTNIVHLSTSVRVSQAPSQTENPEFKGKPSAPQNGITLIPALVQNSVKLQREKIGDPEPIAVSPEKNVCPSSKESQKTGFVGSWVKSLLSKHPSFMPSALSVSTWSREKKTCRTASLPQLTGVSLPAKGAGSFDGFKAKGVTRTVAKPGKVSMPARKKALHFSVPSTLAGSSPVNSRMVKKPAVTKAPVPVSKAVPTPVKEMSPFLRQFSCTLEPKHGQNGDDHPKSVAKQREVTKEDEVHRLRLKLLKRIKAKKNELASLDIKGKAPKSDGALLSDKVKNLSDFKNHKECDALKDFLDALQPHGDTADTESVCTMSSSTSTGDSPSNAELLAELLSPATAVASMDLPRDGYDDNRFLEMLVDGSIGTLQPNYLNKGSYGTASGKVSDCSPGKEIQCMAQTDSLANRSFENAVKDDIFEDLLSSSTLNTLGDAEYLPHFDEYLFENF
ncbi:SUMO-specific isopeptidase USPL1 isoform X2 [Rhinatrema bivittatum]|uniref:SUMO-specific isopeptidase USPL1 isoform X2 n=1 Tax=Rhinatrema bivittatum TaxID=194408 RepID=UPI00112952A1|nr:SUMO-specific isopeptidase USPL1 isoform X2 [Rhinatrema bivittatum]XP_029458497.1 SUMO-specific isopeptidase USPL1 isoform X2 [Rhinatrema bivittatum]